MPLRAISHIKPYGPDLYTPFKYIKNLPLSLTVAKLLIHELLVYNHKIEGEEQYSGQDCSCRSEERHRVLLILPSVHA